MVPPLEDLCLFELERKNKTFELVGEFKNPEDLPLEDTRLRTHIYLLACRKDDLKPVVEHPVHLSVQVYRRTVPDTSEIDAADGSSPAPSQDAVPEPETVELTVHAGLTVRELFDQLAEISGLDRAKLHVGRVRCIPSFMPCGLLSPPGSRFSRPLAACSRLSART